MLPNHHRKWEIKTPQVESLESSNFVIRHGGEEAKLTTKQSKTANVELKFKVRPSIYSYVFLKRLEIVGGRQSPRRFHLYDLVYGMDEREQRPYLLYHDHDLLFHQPSQSNPRHQLRYYFGLLYSTFLTWKKFSSDMKTHRTLYFRTNSLSSPSTWSPSSLPSINVQC